MIHQTILSSVKGRKENTGSAIGIRNSRHLLVKWFPHGRAVAKNCIARKYLSAIAAGFEACFTFVRRVDGFNSIPIILGGGAQSFFFGEFEPDWEVEGTTNDLDA